MLEGAFSHCRKSDDIRLLKFKELLRTCSKESVSHAKKVVTVSYLMRGNCKGEIKGSFYSQEQISKIS